MTRTQSNYFNMAKAVIDHMENNTTMWQNNVLISNNYTKIKDLLEEIQNNMVKQKSGSQGYTEAKNHARENLEDQVYNLGLRLRALAKLHQDDILLSNVKFLSPSALSVMPFNDFIIFGKLIETHIKKYFSQLADFQVSEEDLSNLQMNLKEVSNLYAHRDQVMDECVVSTSKLKGLFGKLRNEMKLLDDLTAAYINHTDFLAIYITSRHIHDLGGHTGKRI